MLYNIYGYIMKKNTYIVPSWFFYFISLSVCCITLYYLWNEPFLRGWDSYFYALKINTWFVRGTWQFSGGNILYLLLTPLHWLGLGAEDALRCWQSFSLFLLTIPFIWQLRSFKSSVLAIILFAWILFSPTLIYIEIGLMKTMAFLICFSFAFWFSVRRQPSLLGWAVCSAVAVCFHRAALPYIAVSSVYMLWILSGKRRTLALLGLAGVLMLSAAAYFFIWPDSISTADLSRISSTRLTPGIISLMTRGSFPMDMRCEIIGTLLVMLVVLGTGIKRKDHRVWYPFFLLLISFCPALGNEALCLGERLGLLFPFMSMLSLSFLMCGAQIYVQENICFSRREMLLVAVLLIATGNLRLNWGHPFGRNQPYEKYAIEICHLQEYHIPMLIVEKGFPYFYQLKTGNLAFPFEPEDHWDKTQIWRRFKYPHLSPEELFNHASPQCRDKIIVLGKKGVCPPLPYDVTLIREDCYEEIRSKIILERDPILFPAFTHDVLHPYKKRPSFLYRQYTNNSLGEPFSPCPPPGC